SKETRARNRRVEFILMETEKGTGEQDQQPEAGAVLVSTKGEVSCGEQVLVPGTAVLVGEIVSTGASGRALLRFPDLSVLEIGPLSQVRLSKSFWDAKTKVSFLSAKVTAGEATWQTSPLASGKSRTSLYTGHAAANFDEAEVRVRVLSTGETQVEVLQGVARVSSGGGGVDLVEGTGLRLGANTPPGDPHPLPARPSGLSAHRQLGGDVLLGWDPAAPELTHRLEISVDPSFIDLLWRSRTLQGDSSLLPAEVPLTAVWRVCPENGDGYAGSCSPIWPVDEEEMAAAIEGRTRAGGSRGKGGAGGGDGDGRPAGQSREPLPARSSGKRKAEAAAAGASGDRGKRAVEAAGEKDPDLVTMP
ncbi:MAG: FecR domain-containing protein, partial [Deltaproteobacteria bacterium]|nr:FecR domain-containing protein [Deltaproteobacteria bacterium]